MICETDKSLSLDSIIEALLKSGTVTFGDYEIYRWLKKLFGSEIAATTGLIMNASLRRGDTCLFQEEIENKKITDLVSPGRNYDFYDLPDLIDISLYVLPDGKSILNEINSCIKRVPGIFKTDDKGRIFFSRIYGYEKTVAEKLKNMLDSESNLDLGCKPALKQERKEPELTGKDLLTDEQKKAVEMAGMNSIVIISGGPGTGKTTIVRSIIEKMVHTGQGEIKIALAAPTGKAVSRLASSLGSLSGSVAVRPVTLHRLLGVNPYGTNVRYSKNNPLPYNFIIIDEFSMVSLEMAYRLMTAVPEKAGLVLIGDKDQLASVEMGAVMREICSVDGKNPLSGRIVELDKNFRFGENSGIGKLSGSIKALNSLSLNSSDFLSISEILNQDFNDLKIIDSKDKEKILDEIAKIYFEHITAFINGKSGNLNTLISSVKIITPYNDGLFGTALLNEKIDKKLRKTVYGMDKAFSINEREWYPGRQIIIGVNDYEEELYNGDIGVCDKADGKNRIVFPGISLRKDDNARSFEPLLLPRHDLAFAMTVHKSQGSEFDEVYFFIGDRESDILNRELIYTAITRARKKITIIGDAALLEKSLSKRTARKSVIGELLSNTAKYNEPIN